MQRWAMTGFGLTLGLLAYCCPARAADAPPAAETKPADLAKAADLVKKLGSPVYESRRDADKELFLMGRGIEKVLRDNLNNSDLEIRNRCERLLVLATRSDTEIALDTFLQNKDDKLLLKLPSWGRFSDMAGKDESARMLFVEMFSSDGAMIDEMAKDPKNFGPKFNTRCQQLQQILWTPFGTPGNVGLGQVVAVLFVASDKRMPFDIQTFYMMTNFLYQQNIQQAFRDNAASRKVFASFIEQRADQNMLQQIMYLVVQMEIKELVPVALKMALAKETNADNKSMAVLIVGKMGTKEDAEKLEPLLTDTTGLRGGSVMVGTQRVDAQLRDVVLAALIEANGQNPGDYGFPYLQANQIQRGGYVPPSWYGFAKNDDRQAALKKFREWQSKQVKR
jgi:hypothetical protein